MPYIKMKCWPKDEAVKKEFVEKLNALLLDTWGCAQHGVTISIEEVANACTKVSKTHIQMLKEAGAFGNMPETSQVSLF